MTDNADGDQPAIWINCIEHTMERFDRETRAVWRRVLESDRRMLMALFLNWDEKQFGRVVLAPMWEQVPASVWHDCPAEVVIDSLAIAVGRLRGEGDDSLVPTADEPGFELAGVGLVTSEYHPDRRSSSTFYLADRAGGFFTRRFMGGNAGEPEKTHGYIDPTLSEPEIDALTQAHPNFHAMHGCLGRLLFTFLGNRAEVAAFAQHEYHALSESYYRGDHPAAQFDRTHPAHPMRMN